MPPRAVAQWLCPSCRTLRSRPAAMHTRNMGLQNSDRTQRRFRWHIAAAGDQAKPFEGFYADLLSSPIYTTHPAAGKRSAVASTTTQTSPQTPTTTSSSEPLAKTAKEATLERARIVFGSRLAGPAERRDALLRNSQLIGGVLVPPRPTEPDNCCMSGCVNCVWDVYRDELEEWAAKSAEARARLQAQRAAGEGTGSMVAAEGTPGHVATSMDDDGGGSEANWSSALAPGVGTVADLLKDVPVGIREFMKTEKMLKQKHLREGTTA